MNIRPGATIGTTRLFRLGTNYTTGFDIVDAQVRVGRVLAAGVRDIAAAHRELTRGSWETSVGLIGFTRAGDDVWDAVELVAVPADGRARRMSWLDALDVRVADGSPLAAIWSGTAGLGDTGWRPGAPATMPPWRDVVTSTS